MVKFGNLTEFSIWTLLNWINSIDFVNWIAIESEIGNGWKEFNAISIRFKVNNPGRTTLNRSKKIQFNSKEEEEEEEEQRHKKNQRGHLFNVLLFLIEFFFIRFRYNSLQFNRHWKAIDKNPGWKAKPFPVSISRNFIGFNSIQLTSGHQLICKWSYIQFTPN